MKIEHNYEAIEEERRYIARELHDGPIQMMTHIGHKIEFVQYLLAKQAVETAQLELRQIHHIVETCLRTLRDDISVLMLPQDIGDALHALLAEYQQDEPTIRLTYTLADLEKIPAPVIYPLFKFVQEALQNVRKHAHATEVMLHVSLHAAFLLAEVCDNGIGMRIRKQQNKVGAHHIGMRIMRERVQEVGGTVEFESTPGKGTCARATFPLVVA